MKQTVEELIPELAAQICARLKIVGMSPQDFDADMPLFGDGAGLDSIDALELVVMLEKNYGIKLADSKEARKVFFNVRTMAQYVLENRKK